MNVVSFSGGKDSTAMLLLMLEKDIPVDEILFFDAGTWEFPQMREHIGKVEKFTGRTITRIEPVKSFDYYAFEHVITRGKHKGKSAFGFPSASRRWCTREKARALDKHTKPGDIQYIGFAADEAERAYTKNIAEKKKKIEVRFPLIEAGMTEREALRFCYDRGFTWSGLYNHFSRVSCWCCPLQNDRELYQLYLHFPDLWKRLKDMQRRSRNAFRMDYTRVEDYERIFAVMNTQGEFSFGEAS